MSKAWIENISDESIVDRYLTYCFDLNHNTEKDAPMTYDVHSIAEKIRKDIRPKTKYHVGTVITWQVRFGGKGPLYHYAAVWTGKKWYITGQNLGSMKVEQMGEYLAGNDVVAVQLATEFEVVK